jgi:hypothetical protein
MDARPIASDSAHDAEPSTGHRWIRAQQAPAFSSQNCSNFSGAEPEGGAVSVVGESWVAGAGVAVAAALVPAPPVVPVLPVVPESAVAVGVGVPDGVGVGLAPSSAAPF